MTYREHVERFLKTSILSGTEDYTLRALANSLGDVPLTEEQFDDIVERINRLYVGAYEEGVDDGRHM